MGQAGRRPTAAVIEALRRDPRRFDFFQAIRILGWSGKSGAPGEVRVRVPPTLAFPPSAIEALSTPPSGANKPPELAVNFFGLSGPSGVLPASYTDLIARRVQAKDTALRDFIDLFHDRLAVLFYAAWEKYRFLFRWERTARESRTLNPFAQAMLALTGMEPPALRRQLGFPEARLLYFAAHFARMPRSAQALADMLSHVLGLPVAVEQFRGCWLELEPAEQTCLTLDGNARLGAEALAGARVWSAGSAFRIRIGPMDYDSFQQLLPSGGRLEEIRQMAAHYVPPELAFDLQLVLSGDAVPRCRLGGLAAPRLGWTAWMRGQDSAVDAGDAVFAAG